MEKEKVTFKDALIKELDGRSNRWLSKRCKIHESEISRMTTGRLIPTDKQVEKIKSVFPNLIYNK